ncbi:MAG: efflux RND transporter permease subunit [Betaproteobacteria bacterium]|jgi:multidrug efflux pump|nr:efflux RND transporter permease subunit [Rhodocyclaceae bacterium]MCA3141078.1 efflux RND transporter permease subunit [Rhodocyclaceae bacterium]
MVLSEISVKRPVLATVMSLVIVLVGIMAYQRLAVREYPNIDSPVVSVRTIYKGASAQVIESAITQPLEDSLSGIEGIKTIKSVSREEVSTITVTFKNNRRADDAANDVRDRVARVRNLMPEAANEPIVAKVEADAQAILWLAFSSDRHNQLELSDYADRYIADQLKSVEGVASVIIGGERKVAMRVWLDRERLAAMALTVQDVENALRRQNIEVPGGRIESTMREFTVLAETDLQKPEQFNNMIITEANGYPVRLRDVGRAEIGAFDDRNIVRVNGNDAIGLGIVKQSTANTLGVAQGVKKLLPRVNDGLQPGMSLKAAFDTSIFIEESISAVQRTMLEALALVVLVIFVFLRSLRATLIPVVTIPVSLIGGLFFLWVLGFSINVLTLLGLVLAIGLVVDDAIVVLENIHRHIEEGMTPFQAALKGSKEIGFAVVAMTITLAAVFAPLAFMQGTTGKLFTEFALTVAAAVIVSGFVALTLTPMMCSKVLKSHSGHGRLYQFTERFFEGMNRAYAGALRFTLRTRWLVVLVFLGVAAAMVFLFLQLKKELSPLEDRGWFMSFVVAPEGSTLQYTDGYMLTVQKMLMGVPEVKTLFAVTAPGLERPNPVNFGIGFAVLDRWSQRERSQFKITEELKGKLFGGLPGVLAFTVNPPSLGQNFRQKAMQYVVYGNSYEQLQGHVGKIMAKARAYPGLTALDTDLKLNKPQLAVEVDREKSAAVGVEVDTIGRTMETLLGGRQVTRFKREGKQYDVVVQLENKDRVRPDDLTSIYVRGSDGRLNQLSNLVAVKETVAPKELNHFNRLRAAVIDGNINPGYTMGQVLEFMDGTVKEELAGAVQTDLDGQSREFREAGAEIVLTFVLALAFIYLVLAAQFESFVGPFVIMLTVPLAMTGALLALYIDSKTGRGGTLNVYSQIGLVMLVGLITKHGILIVEFANQLRRTGRDKVEAVVEAATLRLRPILMTTGAMVLGAVPLMIAKGAGAETRHPIGSVIVGGLLLGTLLTLFVVPTFYTLLVRRVKSAEEAEADRVLAAHPLGEQLP